MPFCIFDVPVFLYCLIYSLIELGVLLILVLLILGLLALQPTV